MKEADVRIVIDVGDVPVQFLLSMQAENDQAWAEDPDSGEGGIGLGTVHTRCAASIAGLFWEGAVVPLESAEL